MKMPRGGALALPALHPAPPARAACAELSSRLGGLPRHAAPPRPPASLRARNLFSRECQGVLSQRTLVPRGLGSPEILWTSE